MIRLRSAFVLLSISFLTFYAQAQSNYQQGYMVTNEGDTVRGFIDQKEWARNPVNFSFKKSIGDKSAVEFNAHQVRYFTVGGDEFLRYRGLLSMDKTSLKPAELPPIQFAMDTVLLKIVVKGNKVSLFSYRDQLKRRFFIAIASRNPEELIYRLYPDDVDVSQVVVDDRYKNQLISAATSTGTLSDKLRWTIRKTTYGTQSITDVVNLINGETRTRISPNKKRATHFYAGAGLNMSQWTFTDLQSGTLGSSPCFGPYFALGFDHLSNPQVGHFVFRGELSMCFSSPTIAVDGVSNMFTQYTVSISPQILYNFYNTEKTKIYLGTGFRLNKSFYSNNTYTSMTNIDFVPVWYSYDLQAGILINQKTEIVLTYIPQWGQFVSDFTDWDQAVAYTRIGVNYHFGGKR